MNTVINYFDRNKIFYPYIINYIVTFHGLIDLFSRAVTLLLEKIPKDGDRRGKALQDLPEDLKNIFLQHDGIRPLIGKLSLKSVFQKNSIDINVDEIASELMDYHQYILPFQMKAAGNLLIMGYEISKKYDDESNIWNFFYHCRNAAAHGGLFNITNVKRFPAKWDSIEITTELNKTTLFLEPNVGGLIGPGDPIRLLWDIEQSYIK